MHFYLLCLLIVVLLGSVEVGAISSATVTPASLVAGASGNAVLAFTTASELPANGKVVVTFPAGFDLTNTPAASSTSEIDGTFVTTVVGQVVTITRQNDGTDEAAGAITDLTLSNIGNPGVSGNTGTFTITTTDSSGATIDTLATVPSVSIDPGAISSATITPASLVAGASVNAVLAFTLSNPLPKKW
jgi:hypothetical protein